MSGLVSEEILGNDWSYKEQKEFSGEQNMFESVKIILCNHGY